MDALTPKQKAFVKEYVLDFNGAQAAIRAGYSKNGAKVQASLLLTNINVAKAIQEKTSKKDESDDELRRKVKAQLAAIAFCKLSDFGTLNESGFTISDRFNELDPVLQACVSEWSVSESNSGVNARLKFVSKEKCLELLGRHLAMYSDKIEHTVIEPTIIEFKDGRKIVMGMTPKEEE